VMYLIKYVSSFFLPPGIFVVLLLWLSLWLKKRERNASKLLSIVATFIYLLSTPYVGNLFLWSLENKYCPPSTIEGDVILMLGGGAIPNTPDIEGKGHLYGSGANRLLTTARLYQKTKLPIILSGGQVFADSGFEAVIAKRQLIDLGVPENKIVLEPTSRNTSESAQNVKKVLQSFHFKRPILVTSAFHMERSVRTFSKNNIDVIPFPTDYKNSSYPSLSFYNVIPSTGGQNSVGMALHEYFGMVRLIL